MTKNEEAIEEMKRELDDEMVVCACSGGWTRIIVPATNVPADETGACCDECAREIRREARIEQYLAEAAA
jgi:hypothetical protein